ncbi:MAG TPA: hypothetical protein DDZ96_04195, partial [Porphyromonadaceae bacterium]|nr:hypothetical protein [Porphyromonadaceae bacterium]
MIKGNITAFVLYALSHNRPEETIRNKTPSDGKGTIFPLKLQCVGQSKTPQICLIQFDIMVEGLHIAGLEGVDIKLLVFQILQTSHARFFEQSDELRIL